MKKPRLIGKVILILISQIAPLISGDLVLPDRIDDKWVVREPTRLFTGGELFGHINGGAELFLEFGLVKIDKNLLMMQIHLPSKP